MHARIFKHLALLLTALFIVSSGCDCDGSGDNNQNNQNNSNNSNNENNQNNQPDGGNSDMGVGDVGNTACQDIPFTGNVNFKQGRRLNADFAQALELTEAEVCNELGSFGCADFVHKVSLGDPEPYFSGVYSPLAGTTISTTLIVERMAVYACVNRTDRDFADQANAVIFKGFTNGTLDVNAPEVDAAIEALHQRVFLRNPKPTEVERYKAFYTDVAAESDDPARDWAVLTCFSVLSSIESAFY